MTHLETKIKSSLRTENIIQIIETTGDQNKPELSDDRVHVFGALQRICEKVTTSHVVRNHEGNTDPFKAWKDLREWHDGSVNRYNNVN